MSRIFINLLIYLFIFEPFLHYRSFLNEEILKCA